MAVWSSGPPGDPDSIGHRIGPDAHGRPRPPVCGISTDGLWFRGRLDWLQVPAEQRCPACEATQDPGTPGG